MAQVSTSGNPGQGKVRIVLGQQQEIFPSDMTLPPTYLASKFNCKAEDILGLKTDDGMSLLLSYNKLAQAIDGKVCKLELRSMPTKSVTTNKPNDDADDDKKGDMQSVRKHCNALQIKAGTATLLYFPSSNDGGNGAAAQLKQWAQSNGHVFIQRIWTEQFNTNSASNAFFYWYYVLYTSCKCEDGNGWNLSASDIDLKVCYSSHDGGNAALAEYDKFTQENADVFVQNIWTNQFNMDAGNKYHYFYRVCYSKKPNGNGWNLPAKSTKMKFWHSTDDSGAATRDAMNAWLAQNGNVTVHKLWTEQFNRPEKGKGGWYCYWTYVVYT